MIVNPTKEQREGLARAVIEAADVESVPASRAIKRSFTGLKKLAFRHNTTPDYVAAVCDIFLIYGFFDRAYRISILLGEIDRDTWVLDYNYVRSSIHHTAYVAHRQGLLAEAAALEPLLRIPGDYSPHPRTMQGLGLRFPFEKMEMWRSQPLDMTSTIAGEALSDLATLSTMWLFGGSVEWPRERIDALYDSTVEQIKALRGWEQW